MKLFYSPGACSLAPHIVFMEAGMKFQSEKVDLKAKTWSGGDYKKINPKGSVPAMHTEKGELLTEGAAIMQFIADQKPETGLMPKAGTMERYHTQEWLNYVASEIHKSFGVLFRADQYVANPEGNAQLKDAVRESFVPKLNYISEKLGQKKFLMKDQFTVADAYLFTCLRWAPRVGLDLSKFPVIEKFMKSVSARPQVKATLEAEGLPLQ